MADPELYRREVRERIEAFYRELGEWGEMPPAKRLRLEGFLEAGILLGLLERDALGTWVEASWQRYIDDPAGDLIAIDGLLGGGSGDIRLPVIWERAPVYCAGETPST